MLLPTFGSSKKRQRTTNKRSKNSSNRYQSLEKRQLLAGDVSVFTHDSNLYIRGDHADNQVAISVDEFGDIQVEGVEGTTINGGEDAFRIDTQNGRLDGELRVNMARGNDSIFVEEVDVRGRAVFYGGAGDDSIGVYDVTVMDALIAHSGRGDDMVSIDEVDIGGLLATVTSSGDDTVGIDASTIDGKTIVLTGRGDDNVAIRNSTHRQAAYIFTQNGNDFVGLDNLTVESFAAVVTGFGSDDVYVNDSSFAGRTYVNGGFFSQDNLEVDGETSFAFDPTVIGFEGTDVAGGKLQTDDVFNELILDGARLGTITELAVLTPELSTLVGALQATNLAGALDGDTVLTAFAPTNSAFDKISDVVATLSTEQLADVLLFHVTPGAVSSQQLVMMDSVETLLGQSFTVDTSTGEVILNGNATLAATDIRAKNGVIHVLNDVLVPTL